MAISEDAAAIAAATLAAAHAHLSGLGIRKPASDADARPFLEERFRIFFDGILSGAIFHGEPPKR